FQIERFCVEPPSVRAVIDRSAADAGGKGPIERVARVDYPRRRLRVGPRRSDFGELRAERRRGDCAGKTLLELAMAKALGLEPRASLEQQHVPAGRGQF